MWYLKRLDSELEQAPSLNSILEAMQQSKEKKSVAMSSTADVQKIAY